MKISQPSNVLSNNNPVSIQAGVAAAPGTGLEVSRDDHTHNIPTAVPVTQASGDVAAEGTASSMARSDHKHGMPVFASMATKSKPTRVLGTIYTNNGSGPMMVTVALLLSTAGAFSVVSGGDSIANFIPEATRYMCVSFIVEPGDTYKVTAPSGTLNEWTEWS